MNNGEYAGPLISRTSPRWRVQELPMSLISGASAAGGSIVIGSRTVGLFEPYVPPTVSAIMVTATASSGSTTTQSLGSGASCHNVVFPKTDRRFFVEITSAGNVYLMVVNEADIVTAANAGRLTMALCEHALLLQGDQSTAGIQNTAFAYSRNASAYLTATGEQVLPYLNGVIAGSTIAPVLNQANNNFSQVDPRLRFAANTTAADRSNPGNLFFPARSVSNGSFITPGTGYRGFVSTLSGTAGQAYVRLEYLV